MSPPVALGGLAKFRRGLNVSYPAFFRDNSLSADDNIADIGHFANLFSMEQTIWRWTKRIIGAGVGLAALLAISVGLFVSWEGYRFAQGNRTHERPLLNDADKLVLVSAHRLLEQLKPVAGTNSLRFAVMPSFGKRWFAVSVAEVNGRGVGEAIITTPTGALVGHRVFDIPKDELLPFLGQWDEMTIGYTGEGRVLTDGNPLAFERRQGARITSGEGNSPCHYDVLADWAAQALDRYVPELQDLRNPQLAMLLKTKFCNRPLLTLL